MMISGITHLRKQLEAEYGAAQRGLIGYAVVSRHDFINAKTVEKCREELAQMLGEEEAAKIIHDFIAPLIYGDRG